MINYDPETTVCFTGHRNLQPADLPVLTARVDAALCQAYESGYHTFLCGGARGFDTLAAQEVLRFRADHPGIRLVIAVPCITQANRWSAAEKRLRESILLQADEVRVLSDFYFTGCMQVRNRFMVDASSLCLCYLVRFEGGTWSTVRYALHRGLMLKHLAMPDLPAPLMKENPWNSISIFRSASENAGTALSFPFRLRRKSRTRILHRSSVKRR